MEHCREFKGQKLNNCWEQDLFEQIQNTKDESIKCQAYLSIADYYVEEGRRADADVIYARLISRPENSDCKAYAEKEKTALIALGPGTIAPTFQAVTSENQVIDSKLLRNQALVLFFWATWCGACQHDYGDISEINLKYTNKVKVIGISGDRSQNEFAGTIAAKGINWLNIRDGNNYEGPINKLFLVNRYPTIILIDRNGRIISTRLRGDSLKNAIKRL